MVQVYVRAGTVTAVPEPTEPSLTVSPNPSEGPLTVSLDSPQRGSLTLSVRSLTGAEVIRQKHQKNAELFQQPLDLQTAPTGLYVLEVQVDGVTFRRKLVKQ